jgi:hypothetical protein
MATEAETIPDENPSSNRTDKIDTEKEKEKEIEIYKNSSNSPSNEEALDIQINYLQSSTKNILNSIIQNESDPMTNNDKLIKDKGIDPGIYLYLQNIHNKYYCNEINYILNTINGKISYINDRNKEKLQNKKFVEREVNTVSQEKIDYFNEKENLDKDLEILRVNAMQNSIISKNESKDMYLNKRMNTEVNVNKNEDIEIMQKKQRLENLKKKYNKIFDEYSSNKKEFPVIKNKNSMVQGENMVLNEKLKQKQMIWDQIRKENERVKTVVIKRDYSHIDIDSKVQKKEVNENKTQNKTQNKNLKVSKIGSFLKGFMSKK